MFSWRRCSCIGGVQETLESGREGRQALTPVGQAGPALIQPRPHGQQRCRVEIRVCEVGTQGIPPVPGTL